MKSFGKYQHCPLRASDIGAGGVGKATADNYQGRFWLPGMGRPLLGPELHLYLPGPVTYTGELRIKNPTPGASIYVDGAFVGLTDKVKNIPLPAGTHEVQLRDSDGDILYQESVAIIAGRTTQIQPVFQPALLIKLKQAERDSVARVIQFARAAIVGDEPGLPARAQFF